MSGSGPSNSNIELTDRPGVLVLSLVVSLTVTGVGGAGSGDRLGAGVHTWSFDEAECN